MGRYRELGRHSIARYDGWYLSNAGVEIDHVENHRAPKNIIVVAFPSTGRARDWYQSVECSRALEVRPAALDRNLIFVDGADEES